ncbi:phosphatase PAP2 family protein [bacterium]|nr:phosphatase PAP2 family protein [bacterium]
MKDLKRKLKAIDILFLAYFAVTGIMILLRFRNLPYWYLHLAYRVVVIIGVYFFCATYRDTGNKILFFLRNWYPVLFYVLQYEEIKYLKFLIIPHYVDNIVIRWEQAVFGFQPAFEFFKTFHWKPFAEFMGFSYFSYFLLIAFIGLALWIPKKYKIFERSILTLSVTYYFCYLFQIAFPVAGPRLAFPELLGLNLDGYFFSKIINLIYANFDIEGAAFPSSHCSAATVVMLLCYRYVKWARIPITVLVFSLFLSTVYGRFHYGVDVIAGILIGVTFFLLLDRYYKHSTEENPG